MGMCLVRYPVILWHSGLLRLAFSSKMPGVVLFEPAPVSHSQLSFIELFLIAAMPVHE